MLELEPENLIALEKRAIANVNIGDFESAVEDLTGVIEADPERAEPYYFRATARYEIQEFQEAKDDAEMALELGLEPELQTAAEELLGQIEQALVPKVAGYKGVPYVPDAHDISILDRSAGYYSNRTVADVRSWYNQQLPAYGWYPYRDDAWCPGNQTVILTYQGSGQLAMIAVFSFEGRTLVMMVVNPLGEAEGDILNALAAICIWTAS